MFRYGCSSDVKKIGLSATTDRTRLKLELAHRSLALTNQGPSVPFSTARWQ